jgi:hypothetical protein
LTRRFQLRYLSAGRFSGRGRRAIRQARVAATPGK